MKDYFLMYLDVDEDLEIGDKCRTICDEVATYAGVIKQGNVEVYSFDEYDPEDYYRVESNSTPSKVKLFACTKSIKAGDKFIYLDKHDFWVDAFCELVTDKTIYGTNEAGESISIDKKLIGKYNKVVGEVAPEYYFFLEGTSLTESELTQIIKEKLEQRK